jgi:hypothetical protein
VVPPPLLLARELLYKRRPRLRDDSRNLPLPPYLNICLEPPLLVGNRLSMRKARLVSFPPSLLPRDEGAVLVLELTCERPCARRVLFGVVALPLERPHHPLRAQDLVLRGLELHLREAQLRLYLRCILLDDGRGLEGLCCLCEL